MLEMISSAGKDNPMFKLSAFADEISPDLSIQIETLKANGVAHIELRGVGGKGVLDHTEAEIKEIARRAMDAGIGFSSIGSPLGKFPLSGDFQQQLENLRKALRYAVIVGAPFVRIFSFFIPKGDDPARHRAQVIDWLGQMAAEAEKTPILLAHENEKGIYGDTGARCLDIMQSIASKSLCAIFDPANFIQCAQRPYEDCWMHLQPFVRYFHIKDALAASGKVVPAGQGDGNLPKILAETAARSRASGYTFFLSLEPHLSADFGATGPERFKAAADGLKKVLAHIC